MSCNMPYVSNIHQEVKFVENLNVRKVERNKKATKFVQELFFNTIMGVSLVALIFGFVILIKVLIG